MNWKFILKWAVTFTVATMVYTLTLRLTNGGRWAAFFMALGVMILLAVAESYVKDWIEKRKQRHDGTDGDSL